MEATSDTPDGLSELDARRRLAQYGPNEIREEPFRLLQGIRKRFWGPLTIGDVVVASVGAYEGILMAAVPAVALAGTFAAVLVAALLLNEIKIWFFQSTGILGQLNPIASKHSP
jgi:magnesium-transporting ATPase (P-type)